MKITDKDIHVLQSIHRFRFLELEQILLVIGATKPVTGYARMRRLKQLGLVEGKSLLARGQAYHLTIDGMKLIRQDGKVLKIGLGSYEHDVQVAQVLLGFIADGKDVMTERELRLEKRGQSGHWPDGVIVNGKKDIAIEVELSDKAVVRIAEIIDYYIKSSYYNVWYFTDSPRVTELLTRIIKQKGASDFIKIKQL